MCGQFDLDARVVPLGVLDGFGLLLAKEDNGRQRLDIELVALGHVRVAESAHGVALRRSEGVGGRGGRE